MRSIFMLILAIGVLNLHAHSFNSDSIEATKINNKIIVPPTIEKGAKIAFITPASSADSLMIVGAKKNLIQRGYEIKEMPNVYGHKNGSYSASDSARAADIMESFLDPEIDAIMCTRGGYGSARLLDMLDAEEINKNPKWLIGYSDITALHSFLNNKAGIASIHGPMCGHINDNKADDESTQLLMTLIERGLPLEYTLPSTPYDKPGKAAGRLTGGNFLVANGLSQTSYDLLMPGEDEDIVLFIEDVGEKIYAIERFLLRMHLDGSLSKIKALIIGEFTEYKPDRDFETMEDMIYSRLKEWGYYESEYPQAIYFNFPAGHGDKNYPLPLGSDCSIDVNNNDATIKFQ